MRRIPENQENIKKIRARLAHKEALLTIYRGRSHLLSDMQCIKTAQKT